MFMSVQMEATTTPVQYLNLSSQFKLLLAVASLDKQFVLPMELMSQT
jgi:hypothetical protein